MKKLISIALASALAATGTTATAGPETQAKGEAKLAEILQGRVAGEAKSCIHATRTRDLEVIDETAVLFDAGNTIWVARPRNPNMLDKFDALVIERHGSQLCATDVKHTIDTLNGHVTGVVFLDDFVPYTKAAG